MHHLFPLSIVGVAALALHENHEVSFVLFLIMIAVFLWYLAMLHDSNKQELKDQVQKQKDALSWDEAQRSGRKLDMKV